MRKIQLLVLGLVFLCAGGPILANNLNVSQATLKGQNTTSHTILVEFSLTWENGWRDANNWDASWVFVKFRVGNGIWHHATINSAGFFAPAGSTISIPTDGRGAFIYASGPQSGPIHCIGAQLLWNYGVDGVLDHDQVAVKILGIEVVYVPQAGFSLGSGGSETDHFYTYPTSSTPYVVASENSIPVGASGGSLYYTSTTGRSGDQLGPIPGAFPKGFSAFYCMKYEASQDQYVDFLNMLTYTQQATRTAVTPNSSARTLAMPSDTAFRNGIRIMTPGIPSSTPAVYMCDLNNNGVPNETSDGQTIPCNWLNWMDQCAYADWAGLRPMTELEYEKACRGRGTPVANEYAWGDANIAFSPYTLQNPGSASEGIASGYSTGIGNCSYTATTASIPGPVRVGIYAAHPSNTGRSTAGGSFYGIMELSGNIWEMCVSCGNASGRGFGGTHGDGILSANGNATNSDWPGYSAGEVTGGTGGGFRGGQWREAADRERVSDRWYAAYTFSRDYDSGCRCVRTAP